MFRNEQSSRLRSSVIETGRRLAGAVTLALLSGCQAPAPESPEPVPTPVGSDTAPAPKDTRPVENPPAMPGPGPSTPVDTATAPPPPAADGSSPPPPAADAAPPTDAGSSPPPPVEAGDTPAHRPINVDWAAGMLHSIKFKPSEADPGASRRDETQTALVDTRVAPRGKLVVTLSGVGGGPGPLNVAAFVAGLGFHAFAVAYENSVNPSGQNDPKFFGDMRFEQFDGMDRTSAITVSRPDCVEVRVGKALAFLASKNPAGDWGYFLDASGNVRWSDVIFMGHSHGATSAAAYAKLKRVWRAISLAGPRDTRPVEASWLTMPSATPIERYFGFTAVGDAQHGDHIKAMEAMKYVGQLTDVAGAMPPFGGSHRLKHAGGHGDSAACDRFRDACRYMLGVQ